MTITDTSRTSGNQSSRNQSSRNHDHADYDRADHEQSLADVLALDPEAQSLLFRDARTANTFTDEPVTDAQLEAVYDLVKWAPTSMNNQPLRAIVVRTPEAKQRLLPLMSPGNRAKTGSAPATAILAADLDFHDEFPRTFPHVPDAREKFTTDEPARARTAHLNTALQIGYFILGVRAAGLAAGPMTGFDADAVSAEFFPDGRHAALVVVNIGKPGPNAWFHRSPRLPFDDVVSIV